MKLRRGTGFLVSLALVIIIGLALMLTGIWYLVLLSGLVASLVVRRGYLVSVSSAFVGGVVIVLIELLSVPLAEVALTMNEVAIISGISSIVLILLMFLVTAGLTLSGGLIGTFIGKSFRYEKRGIADGVGLK